MLDISEHLSFYWNTWNFLMMLATNPFLRGCIFRNKFHHNMRHLIGKAESYKEKTAHIKLKKQVLEKSPSNELIELLLKSKAVLDTHYRLFQANREGKVPETEEMIAACAERPVHQRRNTIHVENPSPLPVNNAAPPVKEEKVRAKKTKKKREKKVDGRSEYVRELMPMTFGSDEFKSHVFKSYSFNNNGTTISRILLEISSLAEAVPTCLTDYSSIFIRTDENNINLLKALIIGPADTPYSLGCFEFDMNLHNQFPQSPPTCNIVTTGGGTFRFNPNLYADGTVCLSLLGTWSGSPEENWNANTSTLLQVFISIQSLIMVAEPFYNEPGSQYYKENEASLDYTRRVRAGTCNHALIDQIEAAKNDRTVFKDVILTHCRLKKQEILKQCEDWNIAADITQKLQALLESL